jgi:hypothetical protein
MFSKSVLSAVANFIASFEGRKEPSDSSCGASPNNFLSIAII